jgi:Ubiquitin carboxyl-terminal hydrolase
MSGFKEFGKEKCDLDSSLKSCLEFLNLLNVNGNKGPATNFGHMEIERHNSSDQENSISGQLIDNLRRNNINFEQLIGGINTISNEVNSEKQSLNLERNQLSERVKSSYRVLEKNQYKLFSIIMHEGTGDHGHYYAFIKDGNRWFKFSDFHVKELSETEVFYLAYGGEGNASAYCVFYMLETIDGNNIVNNHPLMKNAGNGGYYQLLDQKMRSKIDSENKLYQSVSFLYYLQSELSYSDILNILGTIEV